MDTGDLNRPAPLSTSSSTSHSSRNRPRQPRSLPNAVLQTAKELKGRANWEVDAEENHERIHFGRMKHVAAMAKRDRLV
ncbi:unnamed protein product [Hydatigera taeniaeformis]|uniref:Uncharacterized protein n=1 Tax=Hydatigena taeniaeformis TaxID=6205 RepID=A0A0R3WZ46_HYDTA|nr:unnamed protein product [Hydatigera taeniaeformis]